MREVPDPSRGTSPTSRDGSTLARYTRSAVLFLAPSLLFYAIFLVYPVGNSLWLSFRSWDMLSPMLQSQFVGVDNYVHIFTRDAVFLTSLTNTLVYSVVTVTGATVLAILFAVLLAGRRRSALWRVIFFIPAAIPPVGIGMIWMYLYKPDYGLVNSILNLFGFQSMLWLNHPSTALLSIMITAIWGSVGINMLILYAGIKEIPETYYEAARIDGAQGFRMLFGITLPLLKPVILFVVVTGMIAAWQAFDLVVAMSAPTLAKAGGPANSTQTVVLYAYQTAFDFLHMGRASAMVWTLFVIILLVSLGLLRALREGALESYW